MTPSPSPLAVRIFDGFNRTNGSNSSFDFNENTSNYGPVENVTDVSGCFGYDESTAWRRKGLEGTASEMVAMRDLSVGDQVLVMDEESGNIFYDKVAINLHKRWEPVSAPLLRIVLDKNEMGDMSIVLTLDHLLHLNGHFQPAHRAVVGDQLTVAKNMIAGVEEESSKGTVPFATVPIVHIKRHFGRVINPLTHTGRILVGHAGVLAATASHSRQDCQLYLVGIPSLLKMCSTVFPWDLEHSPTIERAVVMFGDWIEARNLPCCVVTGAFILFDVAVSTLFVVTRTEIMAVVTAVALLRRGTRGANPAKTL